MAHACVELSDFHEQLLRVRPQGAEFRVELCRLRFCRGQLVLEPPDVLTSLGELRFELILASERACQLVVAG